LFFVQTDNQPYWDYLRSIVEPFFDFHEQTQPWPDSPRGRTRREILALSRGYPIYRGWGVVKKDHALEDALALAAKMPLPTFNAGPRRKDLDRLERE
jgi:tRNA (guanine-N7-)-methyltransferase